jgi:hypothetical protein
MHATAGKWVHFSELSPADPQKPLYQEWEAYRKLVGQMIVDGYEGSYVLIKGSEIIGYFDTWHEASATGRKQFPNQHILVHEVRTYERSIRIG